MNSFMLHEFDQLINSFMLHEFDQFIFREAVAQACSVKKVFSDILQNSQENICARVSF